MQCQECGGKLKELEVVSIDVFVCSGCFRCFVLEEDSLNFHKTMTQVLKEMKEKLGDNKFREEVNKLPDKLPDSR